MAAFPSVSTSISAIASSSRFLMLPAEAQLLFFHLVSSSDKDGFAQALPVLRRIGVGDMCLLLLQDKGFISVREDLVVSIEE